MTTEKIALVTGANKGIGLEIVRQLAQAGFRVFLTARDRKRGEETCRTLQQDELKLEFLQRNELIQYRATGEGTSLGNGTSNEYRTCDDVQP